MRSFSSSYNITLHYLLYNPSLIPWEIKTPVEALPVIDENRVGCRIVPKSLLDKTLANKVGNFSPSYKDIKEGFKTEFSGKDSDGGWRMEHFINNLFIGGGEGLVDDSPNFEVMIGIMNQKSSPVSSALSITFDIGE
jgi:hypothetical protein